MNTIDDSSEREPTGPSEPPAAVALTKSRGFDAAAGDLLAKGSTDSVARSSQDGPGEHVATRGETGLDDAFVIHLDTRMAKSDLKEQGWRDRDDLDDVLHDLERLAKTSWKKAATLWEKYRPGDADKPNFIDEDDIAPPPVLDNLPRAAQARNSDSTPTDIDTRGDAVAHREADPGPKVVTPKSLLKRYVVAENKFYFRDDPNLLAFEDTGKRLATEHNDPDVARSMVELAEAKSWTTIKVKGTDEFKREVWLAASLRGIDVQGFQPSAVDKARLEELRQEQPPRQQNSIEQGRDREQERSNAAANTKRPPSKSFAKVEQPSDAEIPQSALTKQQRIAVDTLRAILTQRGDSAQAVEMAASLAAERFQQQRVYVGRLVAHGSAPYQNNPDEKDSYYITLKTINGDKTVWGVDLQRAVSEERASKGEDLAVVFEGKKRVTVAIKERDPAGKLTGEEIDATVNRNTWQVSNLDKMREEARVRLRDIAARGDGVQPIVRVYDAAAERKPKAMPERVKQHSRTQSINR